MAFGAICCTHGTTQHLPRGGSLADSARIVVGLDKYAGPSMTVGGGRNFVGNVRAVEVRLNGHVIAAMHAGEFVEFFVPPGRHSLGADQSSTALEFELGQTYYFVVSTNRGFFNVERADAAQGERMVREYERLFR